MVPGNPRKSELKVETRDVRDVEPDRTVVRNLKAGTKRFHNNFPNNSTIKSVKTYIETFATWYNTTTQNKNLTTSALI